MKIGDGKIGQRKIRQGKTRKGFCATEHGDVYYWSAGQGPAVLLLHQASQSSAEFAGVTPLLAEDFHVISFDYPGHGFSDDPDHELTVPEFGSTVLAVLDELGVEHAHLVGHHSGGVLAAYLAVAEPERVDKLVLSGLGVHTEEHVQAFFDTPLTRDLPVDADGDFLKRTWEVYRHMSLPGLPPETTFEFFNVALTGRTRPYDAHYAVMRWDRNSDLSRVQKPTLLICGEHDHFAEAPETLTEQIAGSRFLRIAGGAFAFYEQPVACAEAVAAFLRGR